MQIKQRIEELTEELISLRRDFHMHPELGFEEFRTSERIAAYLNDCGIEVKKVAKTGVVGLLRGSKTGRTVALRADIDGLPVQEENDVPYKSIYAGKMHACAHDGHMAMLLVAAKILAAQTDRIAGNIKFIFQPNEENAGARIMIDEGVLEDPQVDAVLGIHLWTPIRTGKLGITPGPVMAGQDNFRLTIYGKGGHSGSPQTAIDPIIAAANVIQSVQAIQTREIDVLRPTCIIFGKISGGTAPNIIPEKIELEGSIRYLYDGGGNREEQPKQRFARIVSKICEAYRTDCQLEFIPSSPTLINDSQLAELVRNVAKDVVGPGELLAQVCMPGEDFAEFAIEKPSAFYFIGSGNPALGTDYPHHHPRFNIDEASLPLGVEMHVRTALAYLNG